jgi:hypothetical protein
MDEQRDGLMIEEQKEEETDESKIGWTDGREDERMVRWTAKWMGSLTDKRTDGCTEGQTYAHMGTCVCRWKNKETSVQTTI